MRYPLHHFIDKKEKKYVEWLHDDKNFYELTHKNTKKTSPIEEIKRLYIKNIVNKMEKKLETNSSIDNALLQYFQQQEFEKNEGRKSKIEIFNWQKYLNILLPKYR